MKDTICILVICLPVLATCSTGMMNTTTTETPEMISFEDCLTALQIEQGPGSPLEICLESESEFDNADDRRGHCMECGREIAQAYLTCGDQGQAEEIQRLCTKDGEDRFCADVIETSNIRSSISYDYEPDCKSADNSCSSSISETCRQELFNAIGCCITRIPEDVVNDVIIDSLGLQFNDFSDCNFEDCSPPFVLNSTVEPPTISPAMICYNQVFNDNSLLETCCMQLFNATTMPDQYSAEPFCNSTCPTLLAETYDCCEETDGLPWLFLGVPSAVVIQSGCQLIPEPTTPEEPYCLDWYFNSDLDQLISSIFQACTGTDCTNNTCASAVQDLTCCAHAAIDVGLIRNETIQTLLMACEIPRCDGGFDLPCSEATIATTISTMDTTTDSAQITTKFSPVVNVVLLLVALVLVHSSTAGIY